MLALLSTRPDGPDTLALETLSDPCAKRGEVPLSVKVCGVSHPDALIIEAGLRAGETLLAREAIRPSISERVPLAGAGQAIAALGGRKAMGKFVVASGEEAR